MSKNFTIKSTKPYQQFETFSAGVATEELIEAGATDCKWVHFRQALIEADGDIRLQFHANEIVTGDYHDTDYEWGVIYVISQHRGIVEVELSQYVHGVKFNDEAAAATNARQGALARAGVGDADHFGIGGQLPF